MIPQPRGLAAHLSGALVRRSTIVLTALVVVVVGAPLVATAFGPELVLGPQGAATVASWDRDVIDVPRPPVPVLGVDLDVPQLAEAVVPVLDPVVDPAIAVLTASYAWDERGERVTVLQETLGVVPDGWYGNATQRAHRGALEFVGLSTEGVPTPVLAPGPDESEWAALRDCEANGDYTIVSRSGKYRGAYQFDRQTWNSIAELHAPRLVGVDPAAASPADQDAMAAALYDERGARPWPTCGRHLS